MRSILARLARRFWPTRRYRAAVAAILKNEGPYLLEWIAFHRVVGIEHFFIADNISNDGTTELLIAMEKCGLIDRMPFAGSYKRGPQLPAYRKLMRRHGNEADWIAFIDADEFLTPTSGAASISEILTPMETDPKIGAVCVYWAAFGSAHSTMPTNDPVIVRFTLRGTDDAYHHRVFKTIIRSKAYRRTGLNPHYFELRKNFRTVHPDGTDLQPDEVAGIARKPIWDHIRVNHYFMKSKAEFEFIRAPRGLADGNDSDRIRKKSQFTETLNDFTDPMPESLVAATKNEMEEIRSKLRGIGCPEEFVTMDMKLVERIERLQREARA